MASDRDMRDDETLGQWIRRTSQAEETIAALTVERDALKAENARLIETGFGQKGLSKFEAILAERDALQRIVDSVRSKTALDIVAEKMAAEDALRVAEGERDSALQDAQMAREVAESAIAERDEAIRERDGLREAFEQMLHDVASATGRLRVHHDDVFPDDDERRDMELLVSSCQSARKALSGTRRSTAADDRATLLKAIVAVDTACMNHHAWQAALASLRDKADEMAERKDRTNG